jgi:O-antigen/teichoic acid export membrane protein
MSLSIAQNTAFMTLASVAQKIISFAYFTLIARFIGVEDTGKYFFVLSFTTIFVVFVDLGFTNVLVREAAKNKDKIQKYFSTVLFSKIFLGIASYLAVVACVNLMGKTEEVKIMVYISGLTMLFDSIHLSAYGVLRALGNLKYESAGIMASQFISLVLGSIFLFLKFPLFCLILAFTIPSFLNVCFSSFVLIKKYSIYPRLLFDKQIFFYLGRIAVPFAVAAVFARVYSYIDAILLSALAGDSVVGLYSIPYKISYAFQFVPLALIAAMYPRFSEYFVKDKQRLSKMFEYGFKYLILIALPISFGIFILSKDIIFSIYTSAYEGSILPLQILVLNMAFSYLSLLTGAFLNACNRHWTQTIIVGCVMSINIIMNILLIPKFGAAGASVAAFIGNFVLAVAGYAFVPKISKISNQFLFSTFLKILISSLTMVIIVFFVNKSFNYILAVFAGAVSYSAMLFVTKLITSSDIKEIKTMFRLENKNIVEQI